MGLFERLRPQPGWKDPDPQARRAALRQLKDPAILTELWRSDPDGRVREEAASVLFALALEGTDEAAGAAAVGALEDPRQIAQVARSAVKESVSRAALSRLHDPRALGSIARHGHHAAARLEALQRLVDFPAPAAAIREEMLAIALKSPHDDASLSALEHLTGTERFALRGEAAAGSPSTFSDHDFLNEVAEHGKSRAVARRARTLLHQRGQGKGGPAHGAKTDRRLQLRLCEEAEALVRSSQCEPLAARITAAQDAWTDLVPNVDDDLDERFQAAIQAAREHCRSNFEARQERSLLDDQARLHRERHLDPRQALIAAVEAIQGDDTPRLLEDACWEWNRLPSPDSTRPEDALETEILAEARALSARFDAARRECQCRYEKLLKDREEERQAQEIEAARQSEAAKRREEVQEKRDNLARLQKLCERAEQLLEAETLSLKRAEPILRDVRSALDDLPSLPSRRDHEKTMERLKAARAGLVPKVQELRDADRWKRWANTNVQEELCARAEALREVDDPTLAASRLPDLMERWRTAAVAEPDKSQALWMRFKTATDEARSRLEALHAENAARKTALCDQAEGLADSPDWVKTGELLKGLQAEWKTLGPSGRTQDKALWERFRKACDRFFKRRDEDRSRRKQEWATNLAAKEALCARAEGLVESTDWKATAAEIKKLQSDWKAIGAIRPNRSEAIWSRFRGACDRFFERYNRRDQIDLERNLETREAICRDLEALIPSDAAPTPENLMSAVESAWGRWQAMAPVPRGRVASLAERFHRALDSLIAAHPDSVKGTSFDSGENRRRMEELCARLEKLLAGPGSGADESLSPATRLATMWRERMASNTIGGKVAEETNQRAAAEEARKAQAAWQKIGYVPPETQRALSERFEDLCRRLAPKSEREAPAAPRSKAARGKR